MIYQGGSVLPTLKAYTIFWTPNGTLQGPYVDLINRYFQDVGGSELFGVNTQYYQGPGSNYIQNNSTLGGTMIDRSAYPSACTAPPAKRGDACTFNADCDATGGVALVLDTVEAYDPATDTWTVKAPMPTARQHLSVGVLGDRLMALEGSDVADSHTIEAIEEYDPATDAWASRSHMPTPRFSTGVGVVNGLLYSVGGTDGVSCYATNESFDPVANAWTTRAPMSTDRVAPGAAVIGGMVDVAGGVSCGSGYLASGESYDPVTDGWFSIAAMPTARARLGASVVNDILYAIGGSDGLNPLGVNESYDTATNTWSARTPMRTAREDFGVGVVNGVVYVVGGSTVAGSLATVEAYDPATDTWTTKASMPTPRSGLSVGVVNGILYAVGGKLAVPGSADGVCETKGTPWNPLTDQDIQGEVAKAIETNVNWGPNGLDSVYFVYTEAGIESTAGGDCTPGVLLCPGRGYCAYHWDFLLGFDRILYANMPYDAGLPGCDGGIPASPNGFLDADIEISASSHEHFETSTDPLELGWFDCRVDGEEADKCEDPMRGDQFGAIDPFGHHNLTLNGNPYIVQEEWSNVDVDGSTDYSGCVKHFNATVFGSHNSPLNPSVGVTHYRGTCSTGGPCNKATDCNAGGSCTVTAGTSDDTTVLRWYDPDIEDSDLYRGTLGQDSRKGSLKGRYWKLDTVGGNGRPAKCLHPGVVGTPTTLGRNYTSGVLSQVDDPDPALGELTYYLAIAQATRRDGHKNVNELGCPNPGVCNNRGWCSSGTDAGAPCNSDAGCPGGGTCQIKRSFCHSDKGPGDLGGCGRHQVCAGGPNLDKPCTSSIDCPQSSCPAIPPDASTPNQVCLNLTGLPIDQFTGCLHQSQPKSLVRVSTSTCSAPPASVDNPCETHADCDDPPGANNGFCGEVSMCRP